MDQNLLILTLISVIGPFESCDTENLNDFNNCYKKTLENELKSVIINGNMIYK